VAVRNWNGKIFVDIREFYVKDGKTLPTRKGTVPRLLPLRLCSTHPWNMAPPTSRIECSRLLQSVWTVCFVVLKILF
jgi:hypothetical protein